MKKNCPAEHHDRLFENFIKGYGETAKHMDSQCQPGLEAYMPLAFSKWYHTALVEDTLLSPSNIIQHDLKDDNDKVEYIYFLDRSGGKNKKPRFRLLPFSAEEHPLLEDLSRLIDFCTPDREMNEEYFLTSEDEEKLSPLLTHADSFYIEYLTMLAWKMGLLTYLPSIHTNKAQPSPYYKELFSKTRAEILLAAVRAGCLVASERFSLSMELEPEIASGDFFMEHLKKPSETDKIFIGFYNNVNIDIQKIWQTSPGQLTDEDKSIISSFLFTGIMADKWFLFPMANYFGIIRPISFQPIRFEHMVNNLSALIIMGHDVGAELFTPAAFYDLTPVGLELFKPPAEALNKKYIFPDRLSFSEIMAAVEKEYEIKRFEKAFYGQFKGEIVSMKVSLRDEEDFWKTVELPVDTALDDFCRDLLSAFDCDERGDFILTAPDENGFPVDYSPDGSKKSINKTADKTLKDLSLRDGSELTLGVGRAMLCISVLETKPGNSHIIYPRIRAQSDKVTAYETSDDFF